MKECQFCKESVKETATVCPHCGRDQISDEDLKAYAITIAYAQGAHIFWGVIFGFFAFVIMSWIDYGFGYSLLLAIVVGWGLGRAMLGHEAKKLSSNMTLEKMNEEFQSIIKHFQLIRVQKRLSLLILIGLIIISIGAAVLLVVSKPTIEDFKDFYEQKYPESINQSWKYSRIENNALRSEFEAKLESSDKQEVYIGVLGIFYRK